MTFDILQNEITACDETLRKQKIKQFVNDR